MYRRITWVILRCHWCILSYSGALSFDALGYMIRSSGNILVAEHAILQIFCTGNLRLHLKSGYEDFGSVHFVINLSLLVFNLYSRGLV